MFEKEAEEILKAIAEAKQYNTKGFTGIEINGVRFSSIGEMLCYMEMQRDQLTKAKDHIKKLLGCLQQDTNDPQTNYYVVKYMTEAEQFLNSEVEK